MKKKHNHSTRASALQITISIALLAASAILFASSFRAASNIPSIADAQQIANIPAPPQQDGFFPPLPQQGDGPTPPPIVTLPADLLFTSVPASTVLIEPVTTTAIDPAL